MVQFTVDVATQFRCGKLRDAKNFNFARDGDIIGEVIADVRVEKSGF
jgi:hypothetical protein